MTRMKILIYLQSKKHGKIKGIDFRIALQKRIDNRIESMLL